MIMQRAGKACTFQEIDGSRPTTSLLPALVLKAEPARSLTRPRVLDSGDDDAIWWIETRQERVMGLSLCKHKKLDA